MAVDLQRVALKRVQHVFVPNPVPTLGKHAYLDRKAATFAVRSTVRVTPPNRSWRSQEWL